jgi:hypothetical protein
MNFLSLLVRPRKTNQHASGDGNETYESVLVIRSKSMPSVTFAIKRVSFGRRMDLSRRAREISRKAEFLEAGGQLGEKIEAGILTQEIDTMYLAWGLVSIQGLTIDGEAATAESLLEKGPEDLTREVVNAIKAQCGLSEVERKN